MQKTLSVIDLSAIRANALKVKNLLRGKKFYAVVKADAYGHGAVEISREIEDITDCFCVAITDEGVQLRLGGITKPILVLAPPMGADDLLRARFYDLQVTVNSERTAELIGDLPCQIKINTGMNRYGCNPDGLDGILKRLNKRQVKGVYSHLYAADNAKECEKQSACFRPAAEKVKNFNGNAVAHLAASGGILRGGDYLFDGARCGIMLYGYAPSGFKVEGLKPALKVYAPLAQQTQSYGGGVGYGLAEKNYGKLFTYRLGYADGFFRTVSLGEGNLCMDAFVSERPPEGDALSLKGDSAAFAQSDCDADEKFIPVFTSAEEYAKRCGTITYETLCSVTRRSKKIYVRQAGL